jgi:hypothetical protein
MEALVVLALAAAGAVWAAPVVAAHWRRAAVRAAVFDLAGQVRRVRQEAAARARYQALGFERLAGRWTVQRYVDGNRNGVRAAEIRSGVDARDGPRLDLEARWQRVRPGLPGRSLPRIPPAGGALPPGADPLQLSGTDRISCAPDGSCTGGTIYLLAEGGEVGAVVVYGPTGRVRAWRFAAEEGRWIRY